MKTQLLSMIFYVFAFTIIAQVSSDGVVCPGGQAICPDDNTCCQLATGEYGCCALPEATCCSDHSHCCPQGYACNVTAGTCVSGSKVTVWLAKKPAKPFSAVSCQNNSQCSAENTCCKLASGQYSCCPLFSVVCPGGTFQCPDGATCCLLPNLDYGCCPYELGVCCSDRLHCCPEGYTCDLAAGVCAHGKNTIGWLAKLKAKPVNAVFCNDGSVCPNGNTCCRFGFGRYGCCPEEKAVCCSDSVHCCPQGYQCNYRTNSCVRGSEAIPWLVRKP